MWISDFNCLLIDSGIHRVLIDTGAGSFGPDTGRLLRNLISAGYSPNSIDQVILTHGHPDHIGGCTDDQGNLVYTRARHIMSENEWDFWKLGRAEQEVREYNKKVLLQTGYKNLPAIMHQIDLRDGEVEVSPGIQVIPASGHTPGQIAVLITSKDRKLLYISDILFHPVQVEYPEWTGIADLDMAQTVVTRKFFLDLAVEENSLVMAFHFHFPGLGWVIKNKDRFNWEPHRINVPENAWQFKQ